MSYNDVTRAVPRSSACIMPALPLPLVVLLLGFLGGAADHGRATWSGGLFPDLNPPSLRHPRSHHAPRPRSRHKPTTPRPRRLPPECPSSCVLKVLNIHEVRTAFQDLLEEPDTSIVFFKLHFPGQNYSMMDDHPYMGNYARASEWVWASERIGRKLLSLPLDADVLSLYILDAQKKLINLHVSPIPSDCLLMQSPSCRLLSVRRLLVLNITFAENHKHRRDFVCTRTINSTTHNVLAQYMYHCCDTAEFRSGDTTCRTHAAYQQEVSGVLVVINIIAFLVTLFSPILFVKIKMLLKFDNVTKFFRASLKHGITGQRNYVIRISSRQLINLSDPKPFSVPRVLFRLIFHCYGEGRCCIHWWGEWSHQPEGGNKEDECQKCWICFFRYTAVTVAYPVIFYLGVFLYSPKVHLYRSIIEFANTLEGPSAR